MAGKIDNQTTPFQEGSENKFEGNSFARMFAAIATGLIIIWFFGFEERFGAGRGESVFGWLESAWNGENDYEHGILFPFVILGLIIYQFKALREVAGKGSNLGLVAVFIGAALYAISYRTFQPRIAAGALPFLLWGGCYLPLGLEGCQASRVPVLFLLAGGSAPQFPASNDQPPTPSNVACSSRLRPVRSRDPGCGHHDPPGQRGLEAPRHRNRMQRDTIPDGASDDLVRMGVCCKNKDVAESRALHDGLAPGDHRQRSACDLNFRDRGIRECGMGRGNLA